MIQRLMAAALGLAAVFVASPARADYLVYTDRASFVAAMQGESTDTFDQLGTGVQYFGMTGLTQAIGGAPPVTITGSGHFLLSGGASAFSGFYPSAGTYLLGPVTSIPTDGITVSLPANTDIAAGADVAAFASNSVVSFVVTTSDGSTFNSRVAVDATSPDAPFGFLGILLTDPGDYVTSLTFSTPIGTDQNVVVDNLSLGFAAQSVPEPASMALIVAGSLTLGAAAVRRRMRPALA